MDERQPLLLLAGPTAAGKTKLSIELAKRLNGEILSGDSMQVYRGMDIGTAKIREEEMEGIPHHLLDVCQPWDEWNVMLFVRKAKEAMEQIRSRGHLPIVVGGPGFYLHALAYDTDFTQQPGDAGLRRELEQQARELGAESLHRRLAEIDPESAHAIHRNNVKRVIRALEYYQVTGEPISVHNRREKQKTTPYRLCYLVLSMDREQLYRRIDARVDSMVEQGLEEEVRRLIQNGCHRQMVSMQGLGYKEMIDYLEGRMTKEEAVYILKRDTRHFAKRQITWFKAEKEAIWLSPEEAERDGVSLVDAAIELWRRTQGAAQQKEI